MIEPVPAQTVEPRRWARCIARPAPEFGPSPLAVVSGAVPAGLRGALYRNGPARLERGGIQVGHWFDGDGAVLSVCFEDGSATATYRYVQSAGYRKESEAGRLLYGNYGMTAPGPIWNHWRRPLKNAANTSVLALPDRLLALWEGGWPHALDLDSLSTIGLDDLAGSSARLGAQDTYSAHPKQDPETGDIYNFGVTIGGRNATLNLYRSDRHGRLMDRVAHPLAGVPFIHDWVLAGAYLVFLVPPIRIDVLSVLLGLASYSSAMRWRPELGTRILVFDRRTLRQVCCGDAEPWFQWHFGNGAETAGGLISFDFVRYPDFSTNQHLREVASGITSTNAEGRIWRMLLDPATGRIEELACLSERSVEFPTVPADRVGRPWTRTYLTVHRQHTDTTAERYDALGCFEHRTGELLEVELDDGRYPSEPIIASDAVKDAGGSCHQWLLSVVYEGTTDASQVWIFDAAALDAGPVCVLSLPEVVPLGFHGCWRTAS